MFKVLGDEKSQPGISLDVFFRNGRKIFLEEHWVSLLPADLLKRDDKLFRQKGNDPRGTLGNSRINREQNYLNK